MEISLKDFAGTPIEKGFVNNLTLSTTATFEKGGEGSKGGKVIGHTKSGKPIYDHETKSLKHYSTQFNSAKEFSHAVHHGEDENGNDVNLPKHIEKYYHKMRKQIAKEEGLNQKTERGEQQASQWAREDLEHVWRQHNE
jgi:hypothetical protein